MPSDPKEVPCEWCGDPSTVAVEMQRSVRGARGRGGWIGTGMHIYACDKHEHLAEKTKYKSSR